MKRGYLDFRAAMQDIEHQCEKPYSQLKEEEEEKLVFIES